MKKEDFVNSLNYIDYELVEEYVAQREVLQRKHNRRKNAIRFVPVAACLMLMVLTLPIILTLLSPAKNSTEKPGLEALPPSSITGDVNSGVENERPPDDMPMAPEGDVSDEVVQQYSFSYKGTTYYVSISCIEEADLDEHLGEYLDTVSHIFAGDSAILVEIYASKSSQHSSALIVKLNDGKYYYASPKQ